MKNWAESRAARLKTLLISTWTKLHANSWPTHVLKDTGGATVIFAFMLGLHWYVRTSPFGESIKNFEYAILQEILIRDSAVHHALHPNDKRLPVVVDISAIRLDKSKVTDRDRLDQLVDALENLRPAAIGLDIDFSPDDMGRFMTPKDPLLFNKWKGKGNIKIGVFRREAHPRATWLGREEFHDLAAGMSLPEDPQHAFHFSATHATVEHGDTKEYLLELPAALYDKLRHPNPKAQEPGSISDARLTRTILENKVVFGRYVVDYSYLSQISTIPYREPRDLDAFAERIEGRAVLVGDLRDVYDSECAPYGGQPVPGVLVHACSFATLNHRLLGEVDEELSSQYDGSILGLVLLFLISARFLHAVRPVLVLKHEHQCEIVWFGLAALGVLTGSSIAVSRNQYFWPDFLWIAGALFLHPYLAEILRVVRTAMAPFFLHRQKV